MLAHPKGPWVDWSWEESLDFRDSQCVAFFSNVDVTQVCGKFVRSQSVHLRLLFIGWTQLAPFHDQTQDSTHWGQVLLLEAPSQVRGKLEESLRVVFV